MKLAFKQEWMKRLRSGDYEQGTGRLWDDNTFCCLGVAACIIAEQYPDRLRKAPGDHYFIETLPNGCEVYWEAMADEDSPLWLEATGLDKVDPDLAADGDHQGASAWNDDGEHNFADIADMIQESL